VGVTNVAPVPVASPAPALAAAPTPVPDVKADDIVPEKITIEEMQALERAGEPVVLLDVRTQRTFETDPLIARGAIRMPPEDAVRLVTAHRIPWKATLVAYCA
jgi:hypothetical protein